MAKMRHRTFEIFDFAQEASDALESKSARVNTYSLDPELWRFHELDSLVKPSGVAHISFKSASGTPDSESAPMSKLGKDLSDLAELLTNGSRVMLDFEGVQSFDADSIAILAEFNSKLQHKGSRVVLCNLGSDVVDSFFQRPGKSGGS